MNIEQSTINLLKRFEGVKLQAYQDSVGIWTIGVGNTYYEDHTPVKKGDVITQERADSLLKLIATSFGEHINKLVTVKLTQNQFDSLVSICYNIGKGNFSASTLLRLVNKNPNDPAIELQFQAWSRAGGKQVQGLLNRRNAEYKNFIS
jgi:lysozyme